MEKIFTRNVRKYIYGICIAAVPVLVFCGVLEPEAAALVLPLVLAILNLTPEDVDQPTHTES